MTNQELIELKELHKKVKPFTGCEIISDKDRDKQAGHNWAFFEAIHLVFPDLIDELLTCRQGGSFGSDLSNFNV